LNPNACHPIELQRRSRAWLRAGGECVQAIQRFAPTAAAFLLILGGAFAAPAAVEPAQPESQHESQTLPWKVGAPAAPIGDDLAEIDLSEDQIYLDQAGSRAFLELTQNPTTGAEMAVVAPATEDAQWFVVFEWNEIGYVDDDEKDDLDAAGMLEAIREATIAGNEERSRRGWPTMQIVGWQEEPHYDTATNHLTWAIVGASQGQQTINRMIKLLGRKGVMTVTLVAAPEQIATASASVDAMLGSYRFRRGNTYAEYLPGKDSVAEMGLKGLILGGAGAALIKSGLLGKFWKVIVAGVVGLGAVVSRLFGRNKDVGSGTTPT
jgi:uncharacterized membrane-anchored protein